MTGTGRDNTETCPAMGQDRRDKRLMTRPVVPPGQGLTGREDSTLEARKAGQVSGAGLTRHSMGVPIAGRPSIRQQIDRRANIWAVKSQPMTTVSGR